MNSQDKMDLKKFKELKTQRNNASKQFNASHTDEIKSRRILKNQEKEAMKTKDLEPSVVKAKPVKTIKPVSKPVKPIKPVIDDVNYKQLLFTKPKKIRPLKAQKMVPTNDLMMYN